MKAVIRAQQGGSSEMRLYGALAQGLADVFQLQRLEMGH